MRPSCGTSFSAASWRAGELVCFIPPSRRAERVPYTLEGDAVVVAQASWRVREPDAVFRALRAVRELAFDGAIEDGEGVSFDWVTSRRELLARRSPLPVGAICMEGGPVTVGETGSANARRPPGASTARSSRSSCAASSTAARASVPIAAQGRRSRGCAPSWESRVSGWPRERRWRIA
ncbi:MAG: hypothetical protein ACHQAV_04045 [Solirubrobacterales bacterium]